MKKIGISYTRSHFKNYWNWFTTKDLEDDIELIELNFEENNTNDIYKCDGFVLTGGVDVQLGRDIRAQQREVHDRAVLRAADFVI